MADERRFDSDVTDFQREFKTTKPQTYRLAREGRLPQGSFVYLNGKTLRFDIPAIKEWAAKGGSRKEQEAA